MKREMEKIGRGLGKGLLEMRREWWSMGSGGQGGGGKGGGRREWVGIGYRGVEW